jgi:hypothetical protein
MKTFSHCKDKCFQQFERFLVTVTAIPNTCYWQKLYFMARGRRGASHFEGESARLRGLSGGS